MNVCSAHTFNVSHFVSSRLNKEFALIFIIMCSVGLTVPMVWNLLSTRHQKNSSTDNIKLDEVTLN